MVQVHADPIACLSGTGVGTYSYMNNLSVMVLA